MDELLKKLQEARRQFHQKGKSVLARADLAIAHFNRYAAFRKIGGWSSLLTSWHKGRALAHAEKVVMGDCRTLFVTPEKLEVIARIVIQCSAKGAAALAATEWLCRAMLSPQEIPRSTQARMFIALGVYDSATGRSMAARRWYLQASELIHLIKRECRPGYEAELVWLQAEIGFFFWDRHEQPVGLTFLRQAYQLADLCVHDEVEGIEAECRKRHIPLERVK